jgi:hypothetical protein
LVKVASNIFQMHHHMTSLVMHFHTDTANRMLGPYEFAMDKSKANTTLASQACPIIGHTGEESGKHSFSMGCTSPVLGGPGAIVMTPQT